MIDLHAFGDTRIAIPRCIFWGFKQIRIIVDFNYRTKIIRPDITIDLLNSHEQASVKYDELARFRI
jgi:hypothetical protein